MKHTRIYLLTSLLSLLALCGCRENRHEDSDLSDKERLEILDFQIEKHPKNAEAYAERASVLLNLGRLNEAIGDINKAVELDPKNIDYRLRQADVWFANGNVENSYKALSEAEKLAPQSIEVQLKMGEVTFYSRDYDRSLKNLSNVTEQDPNNRTALFMKGFIYKEKGDTANAVTLLRKVCDLYPDYAPAFETLGVLYSARSNPMAVEYLNTAIQLDPNNTNTLYALAMYYQGRGQMDEAETLYRRMLDVNEHSADAWHNLGYIELFHYRDYAHAIEYMTKAIESNPRMVEAYTNRGCAYELDGQSALARQDYEAALALQPDFQPALDGMNRTK